MKKDEERVGERRKNDQILRTSGVILLV